jgi:hypothetical protein
MPVGEIPRNHRNAAVRKKEGDWDKQKRISGWLASYLSHHFESDERTGEVLHAG